MIKTPGDNNGNQYKSFGDDKEDLIVLKDDKAKHQRYKMQQCYKQNVFSPQLHRMEYGIYQAACITHCA
jgi:hypothetical protein